MHSDIYNFVTKDHLNSALFDGNDNDRFNYMEIMFGADYVDGSIPVPSKDESLDNIIESDGLLTVFNKTPGCEIAMENIGGKNYVAITFNERAIQKLRDMLVSSLKTILVGKDFKAESKTAKYILQMLSLKEELNSPPIYFNGDLISYHQFLYRNSDELKKFYLLGYTDYHF